jgi:hypothetical protein
MEVKRMKKAMLVLAVAALMAGQVMAQQSAPQPWDEVALRAFNNVHDRLIAMARDTRFPTEKENYRPHPDVRSMIEELQHATAVIVTRVDRMKGGQRDLNAILASLPKDRAGLAGVLEKARTEYVSLWQKDKSAMIIDLAEYVGEHYGKLVTMYRVNGLAPPGGRPSD